MLFLTTVIFSSLTAAAITSDGAVLREIEGLKVQISNGDLVAAIDRGIPSHRYLHSRAGVGNCRPQITPNMGAEPAAVYLDRAAAELAASNHSGACAQWLLFAMSLQRELLRAPAAAQLRQHEAEWRKAGSPETVSWLERMGWANYEAGQWTAAADFARRAEVESDRIPILADRTLHMSRNLRGLVSLQAQATAEAVGLLSSSLEIRPTDGFLMMPPAIRLADALWQRGEKAAVVRYLEGLVALEWKSPEVKRELERCLREARADSRPSYVWPKQGVFAR